MKSTIATQMQRSCISFASIIIAGNLALHAQSVRPRTTTTPIPSKPAADLEARATYTPPPPTAAGTFVTFDVPGAVNGTFPAAINDFGVVVGYYGDKAGSGSHGFVRTNWAPSSNSTFTGRSMAHLLLPSTSKMS